VPSVLLTKEVHEINIFSGFAQLAPYPMKQNPLPLNCSFFRPTKHFILGPKLSRDEIRRQNSMQSKVNSIQCNCQVLKFVPEKINRRK